MQIMTKDISNSTLTFVAGDATKSHFFFSLIFLLSFFAKQLFKQRQIKQNKIHITK